MLIWARWDSYSYARLAALRTAGCKVQVVPVQLCPPNAEHAWLQEVDAPGLISLNSLGTSPQAVLLVLIPLLLRENPDVVFLPGSERWARAAALFARGAGARVVFMSDGLGESAQTATVTPQTEKKLYLFDAALVDRAADRLRLIRAGMRPSQVFGGCSSDFDKQPAAQIEHPQRERDDPALELPAYNESTYQVGAGSSPHSRFQTSQFGRSALHAAFTSVG